MMRLREGVLRYDHDLDRWCFDEGDECESLHCGEAVALRIADHFLWGRVELDGGRQWYCIFRGQEESAFSLRRGNRYSARKR